LNPSSGDFGQLWRGHVLGTEDGPSPFQASSACGELFGGGSGGLGCAVQEAGQELEIFVFVDYRADSALRAQIDVACAAAGLARRTACEAQNMQYLAELVQHGLGISILPPASVRAVTAHVATIPITPPLRRDICAVTAATHPPTGPAQALLDLLAGRSAPGR
jgi:DNA-binding transcriptional LysR family regulator